jgi:NAD(P)-dependent dehydrogenase (short-subunit alcohol dehydrogenase family)
MQKKSWGRIINIASLQSVRAFPNSMAYGASKGGITQLTRAMAEAWSRDGVCCNAIAPGLFPTELTESIYQNSQLLSDMAKKNLLWSKRRVVRNLGLDTFISFAFGFFRDRTNYLS